MMPAHGWASELFSLTGISMKGNTFGHMVDGMAKDTTRAYELGGTLSVVSHLSGADAVYE
jgi:hypothetical protein